MQGVGAQETGAEGGSRDSTCSFRYACNKGMTLHVLNGIVKTCFNKERQTIGSAKRNSEGDNERSSAIRAGEVTFKHMRDQKQGDEQCVPNVHELEFRDSAANPVVAASKSVVTGYCGLFQVIRAFWCGCMNTSSFPFAHLPRAYMSE